MTTGEVFVPTLIQIRAWLTPHFFVFGGGDVFGSWAFTVSGEGGVLAGPNFDMG